MKQWTRSQWAMFWVGVVLAIFFIWPTPFVHYMKDGEEWKRNRITGKQSSFRDGQFTRGAWF